MFVRGKRCKKKREKEAIYKNYYNRVPIQLNKGNEKNKKYHD